MAKQKVMKELYTQNEYAKLIGKNRCSVYNNLHKLNTVKINGATLVKVTKEELDEINNNKLAQSK